MSALACHLELSGLTNPADVCGGCGWPAVEHRSWAHRPKIVCVACNDTHRVEVEDHGTQMCTRCPIPCTRCRAGGNGAFCASTPCSCACHTMGERLRTRRERASLPVPSYVPATCENVRAAATTSAPTGMFVVVLPPDVIDVGQALHDVLGIFWLNPERDASRWRGKDAIAHACAGCSHALQHMRGRVTDPDTGRPHLHLAGARMLLAVAQLRAGKGGVR